jgi:hypothetical protein
MPRLAGFRTSIESAFTIRPRGRERLPCQAGVLFVNLVNNSSEGNKRSYADLMHNNRSAWRRFGKPPQCYLNKVEVCSYNGLCNRRPLLSRDSKAFEHFTAECCVRATVLASHNEEVGHCETHADREFARELWNLSEALTGIYFQTEDFALFCCAL